LIQAAERAAQDGAFTKAISLFKSAVRLDPHHPAAYLHLADLYLALTMEREAQRSAKEALTRAVAAGDWRTGAAAFSFLVALQAPADPQ
jgi:thioredoxin-like negative regulator of GroEL